MANIFDFGFKEYKIKMDGSYFMGGYFAVMGDTARRVEVRLLGTDNVVRDASGLRLQLWADAGGKVSYVEGEAVEPEKGRYRFDLINGLLLSPGVQKFQWRIIDSDGRKINSIQFNGRIGNDLEGDAWEDVHQLYLNTGQLKKEVDEVTRLQKDLIDGAVDSAAVQQHVEERYSDLEAEYAEDLSTLKRSDENLTAQLAQKVGGGNKAELEDLSPTVLSAIEGGEGTTFNLLSIPQDNSVTERKTTFIETHNLWDGIHHEHIYLQGAYNIVSHREGGSGWDYSSAIIEVIPGNEYTVTKEVGGDRFNIAVVESIPELNGEAGALYVYRGSQDNTRQWHTFTAPENSRYLIVHTNSQTTTKPNLIVDEEDDTLKFKKDIEGYPKLTKSKKNLFDGKYEDAYISGTMQAGGHYSYELKPSDDKFEGRTAIIGVTPNETYSISVPDKDNDRLRVGTSSDLLTVLTDWFPDLIYNSQMEGDLHELTITTGDNQNYLYVHVSNEGREPRLQIEIGDKVTEYEPAVFIDEKYLKLNNSFNTTTDEQKKYILSGELKGYYKATEPFNFLDTTSAQHSDIYSEYDSLVDEFPHYIKKHDKGLVEGDLPMYYYTYTPKEETVHLGIPRPKIIIVTGVHGNEKTPPVATIGAFQKLCRNWKENEILEFIRHNIEIVLIPVANPTGINANTRNNVNNVNPNRDYPNGTQLSTQKIIEILEEHSDADILIDYHNAWGADGHANYAFVDGEVTTRSVFSAMTKVNREWQKRYDFMPQDEETELTYTVPLIDTMLASYGKSLGMQSFVLEIRREEMNPSGTFYTDTNMEMGEELLVNSIKGLLNTLNIVTS